MPLKWIVKVFTALNSNRKPGEIAGGTAFGLLLALQPGFTFFRGFVLALCFFLKVNLPAAFLSLLVLAAPALLLEGLSGVLGEAVLTAAPLEGFFTFLYNLPLVPLTRFNNTRVLGGLLLGMILWTPAFFGMKKFIKLYREKLRDRIAGHPAVKWFLRLPLVSKLAGCAEKLVRLASAL